MANRNQPSHPQQSRWWEWLIALGTMATVAYLSISDISANGADARWQSIAGLWLIWGLIVIGLIFGGRGQGHR